MTESYGDLVEEITTARFTPTRIREGYDMAEVDALLDRVVAALGRGEPVAGLIAGSRFSVVTWREGYNKAEVDGFLTRLAKKHRPPGWESSGRPEQETG